MRAGRAATRISSGSRTASAAIPRGGSRRRARQSSWRPALIVLGMFGLAACTREPRRETVEHGRFSHVELVIPDSPRAVALLLSGPAELASAERVLEQLAGELSNLWSPPEPSYRDLLDPASSVNPPSYSNFTRDQRELALDCLTRAREAIEAARAALPETSLALNTPRPSLHFRLTEES